MGNTKEPDVPHKPRIMLVGPSGGGKTTLFGTYPGKKFLYCFDPNSVQSLQGWADVDYEYFPPGDLDYEVISLRKETRDSFGRPKEPKAYVEWEIDAEDRLKDGFFDQYDAIGFDSTTSLQSIVMDRILYLNGRVGKWPEQDDWTGTMNTILNVFRTFASLQGQALIVLTHYEMKTDKETRRLGNQLRLIGQLRNEMPMLFTDIWACYPDDSSGEVRRIVRTQPDRDTPYLRSSIKGLDILEDVTIENFNKAEDFGFGALLEKSTGFMPTTVAAE